MRFPPQKSAQSAFLLVSSLVLSALLVSKNKNRNHTPHWNGGLREADEPEVVVPILQMKTLAAWMEPSPEMTRVRDAGLHQLQGTRAASALELSPEA